MRVAVLAALTIGAIDAGRASPQDLVLTNGQIVDPATRTVTRGAIWIRDGRIAGRGPSAPANAPGDRIDVNGRWIIPGLVDAHTHSFGNAAPPRVFDGGGTESTAVRVPRAGVTAFLDLFGAEDYLLPLRDRQRAGQVRGAAIFAAGPCFTATRGHCSEYGVPTRLIDSPDAARQQLAALAPKRPDVVKVVYDHFEYGPTSMPTIDRPTLEALLGAAKTHGLKTVVHVGTWEDVRHAVTAGATAITHVPRDGPVPDDVVRLMAQHRTWHIPTLVVHSDLAEVYDRPKLLESPLLAAVTSNAIRAAYAKGLDTLSERMRSWVARMRTQRPTALESVRRLHFGGVRMLTGTDAGNWGVFQGYSVHREMLRLVEAGLTPWDALAAATTHAGEFLGEKYGVQPGDVANLVVLEASPIEKIENTQRISMVVMRGRVVFDGSGRSVRSDR
jgi:imidazolonepropionase-like amidohydrolase